MEILIENQEFWQCVLSCKSQCNFWPAILTESCFVKIFDENFDRQASILTEILINPSKLAANKKNSDLWVKTRQYKKYVVVNYQGLSTHI